MATSKRFVARFGVDNNNNTIQNVTDPVNAQDASTKNFSSNASNLTSGTVAAARMPAFTGDATTVAGATAITLANSGVTAGTYGTATTIPAVTVDAKGRVTGVTTNAVTPAGIGAQPSNSNLTSVAGLSTSTTGLVKFTNGVASLDSSVYLTGNQSITVSGDASGSGTTSIALTLANSGVTAGTYNNSATAITPVTVDAKGRVTATGAAVTITPAFSSITGKPTTLSGYGITDAVSTSTLASTSAAGIVQLTDSTSSTSITTAATPNSVKTAYDLAAAAVPKSGGTMTGLLTLSADPSSALHAATKQYVDNAIAGLDVKQSVRVASTANVTISAPGTTIDGITLATNDRVLLKNQTAPAENGIYIFNGSAVAMTRSTDTNLWTELPGAFVFVEVGTINADTGWVCTVDQGGTLGTTAITWSQFSGAGGVVTAGTGISVNGNQVSLATLADSGTGTFLKLTRDAYGRISGTVAVSQSDITGLLGAGSITNTMLANSAVANLSGTNTGDETAATIKTKLGITTLSGSNTGDQTITLTGDVTGSGTGSFATTLANSGVTAGSYGSSSAIPVLTIDAKGRVTAASTSAVTIPTGLTSGSASTGYINYNGTTATVGQFDGGTTTPTGNTRLNYGGNFYPTALNLSGTGDTVNAATNYFVETGSDGFVRPKTLANTQAEIVTTATVNAAAATSLGTVTTGTWNAGAVTSSGDIISSKSAGHVGVVGGSGSSWYKTFMRNDGSNFYLLFTDVQTTQALANAATFNTLRPISINNTTGAIILDSNGVGGVSCGGTLSSTRYTSTIATGTAPLSVTSTTVCTNLNADMVDGKNIGTSGNTIPLLDGTNTWSGSNTLTGGLSIATTTNTGVEIGRVDNTASTPYIDFHSGATSIDYDCRIIASGGTGVSGGGTLTFYGAGGFSFSNGAISGNGSGLTTLNASNLSSGTVPTARLGTGTADSTTYLRGDGTWATVTSGTSVTLADDTATNATYYPTFATVTSGTLSTAKVSSTKLTFNPSTGQLNATVFNATSDRNAKDNIKPIENALETVKQIQGVSFTWKDTGTKSYGYIAQDIEQVLPEVVATDSEGKKSVNYDATIAVLLEAVKTLSAKVEELEAKLV